MKLVRNIVFITLTCLLLFGCKYLGQTYEYTNCEAPNEIVIRAFEFARLYKDSDTVYEWGGQDPIRAIKIDCSGLVVMCYKYAVVDTKYQLLISDMTANYMYENASTKKDLTELLPGDLVFMGELESEKVTHIALFDHIADDEVFFIDSTKKENTDGVSSRSYQRGDKRFKGFGRMVIKY